jgi:hypothetical protein
MKDRIDSKDILSLQNKRIYMANIPPKIVETKQDEGVMYGLLRESEGEIEEKIESESEEADVDKISSSCPPVDERVDAVVMYDRMDDGEECEDEVEEEIGGSVMYGRFDDTEGEKPIEELNESLDDEPTLKTSECKYSPKGGSVEKESKITTSKDVSVMYNLITQSDDVDGPDSAGEEESDEIEDEDDVGLAYDHYGDEPIAGGSPVDDGGDDDGECVDEESDDSSDVKINLEGAYHLADSVPIEWSMDESASKGEEEEVVGGEENRGLEDSSKQVVYGIKMYGVDVFEKKSSKSDLETRVSPRSSIKSKRKPKSVDENHDEDESETLSRDSSDKNQSDRAQLKKSKDASITNATLVLVARRRKNHEKRQTTIMNAPILIPASPQSPKIPQGLVFEFFDFLIF